MQSFLEDFSTPNSALSTLFFFILICVGGVIAGLTVTVRTKLRRVAYLWVHAGAAIAFFIATFLLDAFLWRSGAAGVDMIALAVLGADLLSILIFGGVVYAAAAGRSNHILGSPRLAWQAFVPLLNLALFFRPGSRVERAEEVQRSAFGRRVLDPFLVVSGLVVFFLPNVLMVYLKSGMFGASGAPALMADGLTLEESFAAEARLADLPVWYDRETVLRDVRAEGDILYLSYELYGEVFAIDPIHARTLADENCAPDMFADELAGGGLIIVTYRRPGGGLIDEFEISQTDCRNWRVSLPEK